MDAVDSVDEEARHGLYVGDRATDVVAASRAGLDAAFVERAHNTDAERRSSRPSRSSRSPNSRIGWTRSGHDLTAGPAAGGRPNSRPPARTSDTRTA
ncbi:HAD hydrolase-like protein [Halobaculum litoreum]|uniref:HAD hydrolase-like protein n=1 Tax=Halobaculum litoreum TaxID=3031998 RepID=A0ABD5Y0S4_9EURY